MKISRILLFSDGLKRMLEKTSLVLHTAGRLLLIILKGFKKLHVDSLMVNDVLLLSNGLIEIKWRVRNAWSLRINGSNYPPGKGLHILYPSEKEKTILEIHIRGLFKSYKRTFLVKATAGITKEAFPLPSLQKPLLNSISSGTTMASFTPRTVPIVFNIDPPNGKALTTIKSLKLIIPPLQTPTNNDQRLLHHP